MNPVEFAAKWRHVELTESAASHSHFIDLCALVGHPDPVTADPKGDWFTFERGATKAGGGEGWADVWKKGFFGWEYKGKHKDLHAAYLQLLLYQGALENPPLLVTCDTDRIVVHTHFPGTPTQTIELTLDGLADPAQLTVLRAVFHAPDDLRPDKTIQIITEEAAGKVSTIAQALRTRGLSPERVARFLDGVVFCLFAEDIGLLPNKVFTRLVQNSQKKPKVFQAQTADLFARMAKGGNFGADPIDHFNGNLFDATEALEITEDELRELLGVTALDWSNIDASIFGTLFERALDPDKRSQLGAHYTSRDDIQTIVEPVVMAPLRREWSAVRDQFTALTVATASPKQLKQAEAVIRAFLHRLAAVTVLDPACGSGNFLYVTLQKLKDLEKEVIIRASEYFPFFPQVGPWQLRGIEVNRYAYDLAQMTVWIGHLQWHNRHGMPLVERPILRPMTNFERKDGVLTLDGVPPSEPEWPDAEFIVSNPPFLGRAKLREYLGDPYVEALYALWNGRVSAESDYCCYWFEKSRAQIAAGRTKRVGLLATQSIRHGASHEVLVHIKVAGDIFFGESDRPWVLDGAAVRVSMVGFDDGSDKSPRILDGVEVVNINSDLSAGLDFTAAKTLTANLGICYQGPVKVGAFDIDFELARDLLSLPNPHGRPNSDVVRPWLNGQGITKRSHHKFIIDFGELPESEAALYEQPFEYVRAHVLPTRKRTKRKRRRLRWWQHGETVPTWRRLSGALTRYVATVRVAAHRLFAWTPSATLPDARLYGFAVDQDWFFGVLQSRVHEVWALKKASWHGVGNDATYSVEACFETFPLVEPSPGEQETIAKAVQRLNELRAEWLNPAALVQTETFDFPARLDGPWKHVVEKPDGGGLGVATYTRLVGVDDAAEALLTKRTLTKLYNTRPAWLQDAHRALDEAVFAAYGWDAAMTDDQLLASLLARNLAVHGKPAAVPSPPVVVPPTLIELRMAKASLARAKRLAARELKLTMAKANVTRPPGRKAS